MYLYCTSKVLAVCTAIQHLYRARACTMWRVNSPCKVNTLHPDLDGHPPRHMIDPILNTQGCEFLHLAADVGVFIATGTFAASHSATSLGSCSTPLSTSIVDYTLASPAAYSLI